jgi:uncharacterized protein
MATLNPAECAHPMGDAPCALAPVTGKDRIETVDVLRGVALLGILLMNILSFGLPLGGGDPNNVLINGPSTKANVAYWLVCQILFEGKLRALFSMLFGAGVLLQTARGEARGGGLQVADIYQRRTMWLLLFGVLHAFFLWDGDILYAYGLFGLFLLPLRKARPRWLLAVGISLLLVSTCRFTFMYHGAYHLRSRAHAAQKLQATGASLTREQKEDLKKWEGREKAMLQEPEKVKQEVAIQRGSYRGIFVERIPHVIDSQTQITYRFSTFDIASMMLIGMALLRLGVLTGQRSRRFYWVLLLVGYGVGGTLNAAAGWYAIRTGFNPIDAYMAVLGTYDAGRLLVALGHASLVALVVKAGWGKAITARLQAVGQMALTGYLATSLICTTVFNGYGFGLFGKLQRYQLLYVVLGMWLFLLVASPIWLRHFRFGPMEWLWRSLTYWRRQPMRLHRETQVPHLEPATLQSQVPG